MPHGTSKEDVEIGEVPVGQPISTQPARMEFNDNDDATTSNKKGGGGFGGCFKNFLKKYHTRNMNLFGSYTACEQLIYLCNTSLQVPKIFFFFVKDAIIFYGIYKLFDSSILRSGMEKLEVLLKQFFFKLNIDIIS
jgi:hypothetical protein